mmetsp:Transcript_83482/g.223314  ORF Transcript_83482/g.223314 Transcript_83482/m.223314 type:complete len:152 (-) Transcript_83482:68-523(-)
MPALLATVPATLWRSPLRGPLGALRWNGHKRKYPKAGWSNLGQYRHQVKVSYPVAERGKLHVLPLHKKICFVTQGWYYTDPPQKGYKPIQHVVTSLCFSRAYTHRLAHTFIEEEIHQLEALAPQIRKWFEEQEKLKDELEEQDASREHVCK